MSVRRAFTVIMCNLTGYIVKVILAIPKIMLEVLIIDNILEQ